MPPLPLSLAFGGRGWWVVESLTGEERAYIADVLRRLRDHFHQWPCAEGGEYDLVGFAYYEGCGDTACCGELLAEAAPVAVGAELVGRHGFVWASAGPKRLAVSHPALAGPVELAALIGGAWCEDPPDQPARGEVAHRSLAGLVRAVGGRVPDE